MELLNNELRINQLENKRKDVEKALQNCIVRDSFLDDFEKRFCWSNNALEGNTLSLIETVNLLDYDEVQSGHTYSEYQEAKNVYAAIKNMLIPMAQVRIDGDWIKKVNGYVMGTSGEYRNHDIYVGNLVEAV